ncbi:venom protein 29-like [Centruroides sculpturatus]|uniref:venom protein 29-like n=1 Tax=Centruroides sculpturatus TaxID=218467 RepID=UPI000C6D6947|nr:venom protein 29-like [Centruroides sculpturatus]XP_023227222.1 venom protein 29-like [Centruroides sculpturatus]
MKHFLTFSLIITHFCTAYAFQLDEAKAAYCTLPDDFQTRILECSISRSPEIMDELSDIYDQCVNEYYHYPEKSEAIITYTCDSDIFNDKNVNKCIQEYRKDLPEIDDDEWEKAINALKYCFVNA